MVRAGSLSADLTRWKDSKSKQFVFAASVALWILSNAFVDGAQRLAAGGQVPEVNKSQQIRAPEGVWDRFRGPNGRGEIDGVQVPLKWTDDVVRWQVRLPGLGHSSPVIWGELVYVTSAIPEDATQVLQAFRLSDGKLLWEKRYPSVTHRLHSFNSYASSTPAVDEARVYWAWANPESLNLVALDRLSGEELWRRDLGPFVSEHGFGASPIVWGDLVILPNEQDGESCVVALERASGNLRWRSPRKTVKTAYSTPTVRIDQQGKAHLVLTSWAHGVSVLDLETGQALWELPVFRYRVVSSPFVVGDLIFASSGEGGVGRQLVAVRCPPGGDAAPAVALELQQDIPYVPTPVASGNLVFLWSDRGVVSCVDTSTLALLWKERLGGQYFASPIRVGDQVLNISRQGEVVILRAGPKCEVLSRFQLSEGTHATPAVCRQMVLVRTYSSLFAVRTLPGEDRQPMAQ